jgi:MarR family transcriptional regulator, lower aerobic nicotinate degradation pathway regulator
MGNKYNSIKRLIELWEAYEEETDQQELLKFAEWLTLRLKEKPELNLKLSRKRVKNEKVEDIALFKGLDEPIRFLEYTSRISRLHDFYIKKFFSDLPINNRLEYLFLYTVSKKREAKKTELINTHLVDYTTGMDTIKRLVNNGLLEEMPDETDKRAKLLAITNEGEQVLELSGRKISDEIHMFLACISMNKWKKTLSVLEEINEFHSGIYQTHNDKTPAELMNLMDSLKHLFR